MAVSCSKDAIDERIQLFAWHLVNTSMGIKLRAYEHMAADIGAEMVSSPTVYSFYNNHKAEIEKWVSEFRQENKEQNEELRDQNIALLKDIAGDCTTNKRDRIAALKELNHMCGFGEENVNLKAQADIEVVID
jgi:hypothetical protein